MITWLIDKILEALDGTPNVKVLVHEAFLVGKDQTPYYFVKVINSSPKNIFTITHVWVKDYNKEIDILNQERHLPHKLEASDIWETWFSKELIEDKDNIFKNVRVVLSNGKTYKSKKNSNVRPLGSVA